MIFVQDSLGAQEADTVQHVISAAGAPQDTLGSRVDLQAVSETVTEAEGMPIPYSPRTDDGLAMILLGCFFVSAYVLARSKKFLLQQVKDFMLHRERTSIFASSTAADMRYLLLLIVQTCVLGGVCIFNYFNDIRPALMERVSPHILLGVYVAVCLLYLLFKWILYSFLGWVFFDKSKTDIWLESYSTLIYYLGLALRLYASANNLFLITASDFTGYDPEGTSQGDSNKFGQNMVFFSYPRARTFTFGVNVTF